jgi:hypothetical protein
MLVLIQRRMSSWAIAAATLLVGACGSDAQNRAVTASVPAFQSENLDGFRARGDFNIYTDSSALLSSGELAVTGRVENVEPGRIVSAGGSATGTLYSTVLVTVGSADSSRDGLATNPSTVYVEIPILGPTKGLDVLTQELSFILGKSVLVVAGVATQNFKPVTSSGRARGPIYSALPQGFVVQDADESLLTLQYGGRYLTELNGIKTLDDLLASAVGGGGSRSSGAVWQLPSEE